MSRRSIISSLMALALVLVLAVGGYWRSLYITNPGCKGETMGTTYSIRITGKVKKADLKELTNRINAELKTVNFHMSTWDPNSEISRFNHSASTEPIKVSEDFAEVVKRALGFSAATGGAFDPTLQPLLNLWGFGSEGTESGIPSDAAIAEAKAKTGWQKIHVEAPDALQKTEPELSLALGGIAKGYGVDAVGQILDHAGLYNWFVEIGGEVVVKGLNPEGVPWKVGIQYPSTNPLDSRLQGILHLSSGAIATSGDYRNYMSINGVIYSHILDPRTGRAALSDAASVSVSASNCTDADAMATALFVMGPEEGLAWVEKTPRVEAMFLVRSDDGSIIEKFSSGFQTATGYISEETAVPR